MASHSEVLEIIRKGRQRSLLTDLTSLRDERCMTDVILIVDSHVFPVHRVLLIANSLYFREVFKKKPNVTKITISDVDVDVFTTILNFIYNGRLSGPASRDHSKFPELISALKSLRVVNYEKVTGEVVLNTLAVDTFYKLWVLAKTMNLKGVEREIAQYVAKKLELCSQISDFLLLTLQQLISVMASASVRLLLPDVVLLAVSTWADAEPVKRRKYLPALLSLVGLQSHVSQSKDFMVRTSCCHPVYDAIPCDVAIKRLLPAKELSSICNKTSVDITQTSSESSSATTSSVSLTSPPVSQSLSVDSDLKLNVDHLRNDFGVQIEKINLDHLRDESGDQQDDSLGPNELVIDRFGSPMKKLVDNNNNNNHSSNNKDNDVAILDILPVKQSVDLDLTTTVCSCVLCIGQDDISLPVQAFYDYKRQHWLPLEVTIRVIGDNVTTLLHKRSLYYLGGELPGHEPLNSAYVHMLDTHTLNQIANMSVARYSAGAVCCADRVYVIGGLTNHSDILDDVERYNSEDDSWEIVPNLLYARCNPSVAATSLGVYVVSGFLDNYNYEVCFSCEFFSLSSGQWSEISRMPTGICALPTAITAIDDDIYLIRLMKPNKIYQYDRSLDEWVLVCHCNSTSIQVVALLNVQGWLWVVDENRQLFKFNFESEDWQIVTAMPDALYPPFHVFVLEK